MAQQLPEQLNPRTDAVEPDPLAGFAILLFGKHWRAVLSGKSRSGWHRITRFLTLQFIPRGVLVVVSSTLPLVLAIFAGVYAKEIYETTRQYQTWLPRPHWVTLGTLVGSFWIGCIAAVWLFVARAREQKWANEELKLTSYKFFEPTFRSIQETRIASFHFATPALFNTHHRHFTELHEHVAYAMAEGTEQALVGAIREGLKMVATMASRHASAPDTASYGANVMLVASGQYPRKLLDRLIFLGRRNDRTEEFYTYAAAFCGKILYLPSDLLVSNLDNHATRTIPDIALPVPPPDAKGADTDVIPGAPFALFHGSVSVHRDTHLLADEYRRFAETVREELRDYFKSGAGKDVRSFASFRIGTGFEPVGVLNIDSNAVDVLGIYEEPLAMETFRSVLTPVVLLLREPISRYAGLTYADRFQ